MRCISTVQNAFVAFWPRKRHCDAHFICFWYDFSFGSKVIGNRTGIIFNNEMDDFSTPGTSNAFGLPASKANYISINDKHMILILLIVFSDTDF